MANTIYSVRMFAGTVESQAPEFRGLKAPAVLMMVERDGDFECKFIFFAGDPLPLTIHAPKNVAEGAELRGVANDPRGWDVTFRVQLQGDEIRGSYQQPHDHGTFVLHPV